VPPRTRESPLPWIFAPCRDALLRVYHSAKASRVHMNQTHRLVKFRTYVSLRNYGWVYRRACEAFERAREFLMMIAESSPHLHGAEPHGRKPSSFGPISTETAVQSDQPDDICTEGGSETKDKTTPDVAQDQGPPTCGQCKGGLSFPIWYCIFCEGRSQGRRRRSFANF